MKRIASNALAGGRRRWISLVVVCLAQLMNVLDTTIVNVALPEIQRDLHFTQGNLTWVVNAFLITFGGFLLLAGRLGDLAGRRRIFLAGVALFTASSALCGLAPSQGVLIGARFAQGVGSALSTSAILAIIVTEFQDTAERARAMSAYVFTAVAGGSLGLLAGGLLTEAASWHWIFFVNVPIGIATLLAGAALIPRDQVSARRERIDWLGSLLVTLSLMVGVYGILQANGHGFGSLEVLGLIGASLALMAAFAAVEHRVANPILPLRVLRLRALIGASAVRGFLVTGMYSTFFLGTLYLEHVLGYGSLDTGLAFMPWTVTVGALSLGVTARMVRRFGAMPVLLTGLVSVIAGLALLVSAGAHTQFFPTIFVSSLAIGFGVGSAFMPLLTIAMADIPAADAGLGSGIVNVSQQVAGALGLAILGTIATDRTHALAAHGAGTTSALLGGYHLGFEVGIGALVAGIVLALAILRNLETPPQAVAEVRGLPARPEAGAVERIAA